tara:strand:- start:5040 stop:5531 length:492 start_codon:yes stop_codon:yes gene_type:complete
MKIKFLSKREINSLLEELNNLSLISTLPKLKQVKSFELNSEIEILSSSNFIIVRNETSLFPFLKDSSTLSSLPKLVVDKGAIPFVCKGANIMRPGIKKISNDFPTNSIVVISEDDHDQNLAVGKSLHSSEELLSMSKGMVVENLHFVGDNIWNSCKDLNLSVG